MISATKESEGQVIAGFRLRQYLGGRQGTSVFLTERPDGTKAAIKLIAAEGLDAEKKLSQWKLAIDLAHPHLLRLFDMGRCEVGGIKHVYVVMENAEENLSEVLPDRSLSPREAREMLSPVLDALSYLHGKGLVHGQLKPSNILAVKDQLKLATDGLQQAGEAYAKGEQRTPYDPPEKPSASISASADVWRLGITLVEILTQRIPTWENSAGEPVVPATIEEPFRDIARNSLKRDPNARWTVPQIAARLKQVSAAPAAPASPVRPQPAEAKNWKPAAIAVVALVLLAALALMFRKPAPKAPSPDAELAPPKAEQMETVTPKPSPARPAEEGRTRQAETNTPARERVTSGQGDVVHQVLPKIAPGAQRTITGKIKIRARVHVDPAGNVTRAELVNSGPSKYFARLSHEAALQWKFVPAADNARNRQWLIRFDLTRKGTTVSADPVRR